MIWGEFLVSLDQCVGATSAQAGAYEPHFRCNSSAAHAAAAQSWVEAQENLELTSLEGMAPLDCYGPGM